MLNATVETREKHSSSLYSGCVGPELRELQSHRSGSFIGHAQTYDEFPSHEEMFDQDSIAALWQFYGFTFLYNDS